MCQCDSEQLILFVYLSSKSGQIVVHHHVCARFKCKNYCVAPNNLRSHFLHPNMHAKRKVHAFNKLSSTMFTNSSSWCYINLAHRPSHVCACVQVLLVCLCHDRDARLTRRRLDICVWFSLSIALCTDVKTRRSAWRCPRSIYQHMINRSTEYSLPTHLVRNDFNSALSRSNNKKIVNSNSFQTMN